jgi:hypothetical protein
MNCADAAHLKFAVARFAKHTAINHCLGTLRASSKYPLDTQNIPNREDADSGRLTWCNEFDPATNRQADN